MALAPQYYQEARENAPFHLIVTDLQMSPAHEPFERFRLLRIIGKVEQVLRGHAEIEVGDQIEFNLPVLKPGWGAAIGGDHQTDYDRLVQAQRLEIYLQGTPPRLNHIYGMVAILK